MTVRIEPSTAHGTVCAPPSKSAAHRALICGALSDGCRVEPIAYSEDIAATLDGLQALGAHITRTADAVTLGGLSPFDAPAATLACRESGSTLRFLVPLALLGTRRVTFCGSERLFARNLDVYAQLAREQGLLFERGEASLTVQGTLQSGVFSVVGDISSQFISGLLFALPLLAGDSTLHITGTLESEPYIGLTIQMLSRFGVHIVQTDARTYHIAGGQKYHNPQITVEGDCSNAAFLDALNLLGGTVTVNGLEHTDGQGDRVYREMFEALRRGVRRFDMANCPDLAPVMFALAAYCGGAEFTGTRRLKLKESDRAVAMRQELSKFGIPLTVEDNRVMVGKASLVAPTEVLCGHNDHRVVMALALLCSVVGGTIDGAEAVAKSYPDFFEVLKSLGIVVETDET